MFDCLKKKPVRELPEPDQPIYGKLGVIVGHTKRAKGARFYHGGAEYDYNLGLAKDIKRHADRARTLDCSIFTRDSGGISGAYSAALQAGCDVIIELHFNAFNGKVKGTETLCTTDQQDRDFAGLVHKACCEAMRRGDNSRGVKVLSRSSRGGRNVYSAGMVPNCLIEPFFGDNEDDAGTGLKYKNDLADRIVGACCEYLRARGLS